MNLIERKQGLMPLSYLFANNWYYATLADYTPRETYSSLLSDYASRKWIQVRKGAWLNFSPPDAQLPKCGFKIHISSSLESAVEILTSVAELAFSKSIPFKFLVDEVIHDLANSKNYSAWGCGKFITLFPKDKREFLETLTTFSNNILDSGGPYIHSDLHAPGSQSVFYRFGSFTPPDIVNVYGEYERYFTVNGERYKDETTPIFSLPSGLHDPMQETQTSVSPNGNSSDEIILNNRYLVTGFLHRSNAGSVILAEDQLTGETVVVKEARYGVTTSGIQATRLLHREYKILILLKNSGVTPKPIDFFGIANNSFLVMEHIEGIPLSKFRSSPVFTSLHRYAPSPVEVKKAHETLHAVWNALSKALKSIHDLGVVIGDLAPQNIIIDPKTLKVWVIDFEAARYSDDDLAIRVYTIGYRERDSASGTAEEDSKALRKIISSLILPVQTGSVLNPLVNRRLLRRYVNDYPEIRDVCFKIEPGLQRKDSEPVSQEKGAMLDELINGVKNGIGFAASGYLWACDYRGLNTNPLSIAFGALGVAPTLSLTGDSIANSVHDWISEALKIDRHYAPGLFVGSAGIAWGLADLGRFKEAEEWLRRAIQSDMLLNSLDIFFGASGIGMTCLHFYSLLGQQEHLEQAISIANDILQRSNTQEHSDSCAWALDYNGFGHGHAGLACFFLSLYRVTEIQKYLELAESIFKTEISRSYSTNDDALYWKGGDSDNRQMPYFRIGSAGIGAVACRLYEATQDTTYLKQCISIAKGCNLRYSAHPGLFTGISGIGEFYLDLQRSIQTEEFTEQLDDIVDCIKMFLFETEMGLCAPSESLTRLSFDYGTGSSGIALFIHRLLHPQTPRRFLDVGWKS